MFSGIVSKASTLDVLSTGVAGNYNGAFQVVIWNSIFTFEKLFNISYLLILCWQFLYFGDISVLFNFSDDS